MILRNLTRANLSVEKARYIVSDLGDRIAKAGSPFALSKDDIKVGLQGITSVKRSQPTAFVEDVLSFIYHEFSIHEALVLQQKFQVSISDFSLHLKNGDKISSRLFHFNNPTLVYQNYRNYFKALWLFEGKREELQNRISRSVSDHFNLKPLSLPMIVGATVLADMHSYGILSADYDTYKTQLMAKNSENTTDYMTIFVPSDIAELIVRARQSNAYYSAMVTPNYYCEMGKILGGNNYIDSLGVDTMKNLAITYFHSIESSFSNKLKVFFLKHELSNALAVRDIANSLYIVWCFKRDYPDVQIPTPAARTLGKVFKKYDKPGDGSKLQGKIPTPDKSVRHYDMTLWDDFTNLGKDSTKELIDLVLSIDETRKLEAIRILKGLKS